MSHRSNGTGPVELVRSGDQIAAEVVLSRSLERDDIGVEVVLVAQILVQRQCVAEIVLGHGGGGDVLLEDRASRSSRSAHVPA